MKKTTMTMLFCLLFAIGAKAVETMVPDTVIQVGEKRIEVIDNDDRLKVRVYEERENEGIIEEEMVFEGHYRNGRSYENRRRANAIVIPLPNWKRSFDGHWAGFGLGFATVGDSKLNFNNVNGISLNSEKSFEINFNLLERTLRLGKRSNFALVTGLGIRWDRYRLKGNEYFKEVDGTTQILPAPEGTDYYFSRLNVTSLTVPLLLEYQTSRRRGRDFFLSAGVVGVVKTASSSRVKYYDATGGKHKEKMGSGMNLRPVTLDLLVQAGFEWFGIYVKYSPFGLFEHNAGPDVHPASVGMMVHF